MFLQRFRGFETQHCVLPVTLDQLAEFVLTTLIIYNFLEEPYSVLFLSYKKTWLSSKNEFKTRNSTGWPTTQVSRCHLNVCWKCTVTHFGAPYQYQILVNITTNFVSYGSCETPPPPPFALPSDAIRNCFLIIQVTDTWERLATTYNLSQQQKWKSSFVVKPIVN
jgi:hypothetical protein